MIDGVRSAWLAGGCILRQIIRIMAYRQRSLHMGWSFYFMFGARPWCSILDAQALLCNSGRSAMTHGWGGCNEQAGEI